MAATVIQSKVLGYKDSNVIEDFETKVKQRLGWSRKKWIDKGEVDSKFHRMTNSVRYWSQQLNKSMASTNVIVGLFSEESDASLSLVDFFDEFIKMGVNFKLTGFTSLRNPKYLCFSFNSEETKQYVVNNMKMIGAYNVIYLHWALSPKVNIIKVHWVVMEFPVEKLITFIENYGVVKEYAREENSFLNGEILKNGTITFKVELKDNVSLRDIPHLQLIEGVEFLINVTGRQVMCLNCTLLGHKSSECPTPFCRKCKAMKKRNHTCENLSSGKKSYANVVGSDNSCELVNAIKEGALGSSSKILLAGMKLNDESSRKNVTSNVETLTIDNVKDVEEKQEIVLGEGQGITSGMDLESDGESLSDQSEDEDAVAQKMNEYCEELRKLREEANGLNTEDKWKLVTQRNSDPLDSSSDGAIFQLKNLKRKSEKVGGASRQKLAVGTHFATYSRRRRGRSRRGGSSKPTNKFLVLTDHQDDMNQDSGQLLD